MKIKFADIEINFDLGNNGLPIKISLNNKPVVELPLLSVKLEDDSLIYPFCPVTCKSLKSITNELCKITFEKLLWKDKNDKIIDDFYLSLVYEIWSDGTMFVDTFFFVENTNPPTLKDLKLELPLNLEGSNNLRWGFIDRPTASDFAMIQSSKPERFLLPGLNRKFSNKIIPLFNFDGKNSDGIGFHYEFFVEGHSSLSGKKDDVSTQILWEGNNSKISWNFQTTSIASRERPWQWRNRWGCLLTHPPVKRNQPPTRIYHYFDNYERYPSIEQLSRIIEMGADVIILHENWRLDAQNGGIPYNWQEFQKVIKFAHKNNIRIAVYIRGNEESVYSDYCSWFDEFLQKDYDGLYVDYGGPIHGIAPSDEVYSGGRMLLRNHHQNIRNLRKRVGKNGLLFLHTGPCFSAIGMTGGIIDGYVSGEGERGIMIENRNFHGYFSAANVTNGTMWTAAFPEYSSSKIIPFLAATGQTPHVPLGIQFANSSLAHPRTPGINDIYLRPLWKLWGIFKNERNIDIFNDYNCKNIFNNTSQVGKYLMVAQDKQKALLIVSNFTDTKSTAEVKIDWEQTGFTIDDTVECLIFKPNFDSPEKPIKYKKSLTDLSIDLEGYGVAGLLFSTINTELSQQLENFLSPYIEDNEAISDYLKHIENQKKLRDEPTSHKTPSLRIEVENLAVPYEESMWWDLFDNAFQIGVFDEQNKFEPFGWISSKGLVDKEPEREEYIWPGHKSPWIKLNNVLPTGIHKLGIHSIHLNEPFYSFVKATISPASNDNVKKAQTIEFLNELEVDRSFLRFTVNI